MEHLEQTFELYCLQTPSFSLDGGALFGVVPKVMWEKANPCDSQNRVKLTTRALYLRLGARHILVDPGIGDAWDERFKARYEISGPSLLQSLESIGVSPLQITDVVLTHLHFDHVGGCFVGESGDLKSCFSNATHWVQQTQWKHAQQPTAKDRGSYINGHIEGLKALKLELLDGEVMLFDRIRCLPVDGHTFSQQLLSVEFPDKTYLYGGDLFPMQSILNMSWVMAYDVEPLETIRSKRRIGERYANSETFLILTHEHDMVGGSFCSGPKNFELVNPIRVEGPVCKLV